MATKKLTKRNIDGIPAPAKGEVLVWDATLKGFGLRVSPPSEDYPKGKRTFLVQGRIGRGRKTVSRRWTIGTYGEFTPEKARTEAEKIRSNMRLGINPREVAQLSAAQSLTVGAAAAKYLSHAEIGRHTRSNYEKIIANPLTQLGWLDKPLASITREDVLTKYKLMRKHGLRGKPTPDFANHTFNFLQVLFHRAMAEEPDIFPSNPVTVLKGIRAKPKARTRHIPDDKLSAVWKYLQAHQKAHNTHTTTSVALVSFLLLTGARLGEASTLKWENVNLEEGWWFLEKTKNGSEAKLPLPTQAIEILEHRPTREGYVFASYSEHIKGSPGIMKRVSEVAGCPLSHHDLRRTFSQVGTRLCGLDSAKVARLTNHVLQGVFGINYDNNPDMRHLKPAVQQIADRVCS